MKFHKIFEEIQEYQTKLFEELSKLEEGLTIDEVDNEILTTEEQAKFSLYIKTYRKNQVALGLALARVTALHTEAVNNKNKLFGKLYVEVTDKLLSAPPGSSTKPGGSSKYDVNYRTGKVTQDVEYQELLEAELKFAELKKILESLEKSLTLKLKTIPGLMYLESHF